MIQIEALKLALETLKWSKPHEDAFFSHRKAITAIEEALAQTQEPVAWMDADGNVSDNNDHKCFPIPLYTTPPQLTWVDLPDEEIKILWIQYRAALPRYLCFAKALLARAKEENT